MASYRITERNEVVDGDGVVLASTDISGWSDADRRATAEALVALLEGKPGKLPLHLDYHWIVGGRATSGNMLMVKSPSSIPKFADARTWSPFARLEDREVALKLANLVNEGREWDVDRQGVHRHVIDNKSLVVGVDPANGRWLLFVDGEQKGHFGDVEEAKEAALLVVHPSPGGRVP